jgi:hypothetical protein
MYQITISKGLRDMLSDEDEDVKTLNNLIDARQSFDEQMNYYFKLFYFMLKSEDFKKCNSFDYPKYGGLPKSISLLLSSEMVDRIQERLTDIQRAKTIRELIGLVFP